MWAVGFLCGSATPIFETLLWKKKTSRLLRPGKFNLSSSHPFWRVLISSESLILYKINFFPVFITRWFHSSASPWLKNCLSWFMHRVKTQPRMGQSIWLIFQQCLVVNKFCLSHRIPALAAFRTFHVEISSLLCKVGACGVLIRVQSLGFEDSTGQVLKKK